MARVGSTTIGRTQAPMRSRKRPATSSKMVRVSSAGLVLTSNPKQCASRPPPLRRRLFSTADPPHPASPSWPPFRNLTISATAAVRTEGRLTRLNQLRSLFTSHPWIVGRVLGIVYRVIGIHLIKKAGQTHKMAHTGAVTLIHWVHIPVPNPSGSLRLW